jgi:hypothetical protein
MGVTAIVRAESSDSEALLRSADRKSTGMDTGKCRGEISDRKSTGMDMDDWKSSDSHTTGYTPSSLR